MRQPKQGCVVLYTLAPCTLIPKRAAEIIAFCSAWTSDASRNALKPTGESIGSEFLLTTKHNPKYTTRIIHCAVKKRNGTTLSALPNVFAQDFRATRPQSRWGRLQSQIDCVEGRRHIRMRELGVRTGNPGKLAELPWHSHPTRRWPKSNQLFVTFMIADPEPQEPVGAFQCEKRTSKREADPSLRSG